MIISFSDSCLLAGRTIGGCEITGVNGNGNVIGLGLKVDCALLQLDPLLHDDDGVTTPNSSLRFRNGLFLPSKSFGGGMNESSVPRELVSSPEVSAGVDGVAS